MIDQTAFIAYKSDLRDKIVQLISINKINQTKFVFPRDNSRYFEKGRKRIKAKIFKRLGSWSSCPGVLLTCTFDPARITKEEAWAYVGAIRRKFLNRLNMYRKKKGMVKAKGCFVLEVQPGTGYPHLHGVFPYLKWLAPKAELERAWGFGFCEARAKDSLSPTKYVLKYITKMNHWEDEHFNYCWLFGTRLYSLSRDYSLPNYSDKRVPEWKFYAVGDIRSKTLDWFSGKHLLQRIREGPEPFDHGAIVRSQFGDIDVDLPQDI